MAEGSPPLLTEIDAARAGLRSLLTRVPETVLAQRTPPGQWSIYENVRHLLFAEQLHMSQLFHEIPAWSPLGYTDEEMRALRKLPVPDEDGPSLKDVWIEWDRIHRRTARRVAGMPAQDVEHALTRHLAHLQRHIEVIERLVRRAIR